jgi:outer membrane protein
MKTNLHYTSLFIALALIWANAANADTAAGADTTASANNGWSVKVGINQITPHVTSGNMTAPALPGTKIDVGSDTQPIVSVSYAYDDHLAAELVLGTPYKHNLIGAGSIAGVGTAGTVEALPPTVFAQYRFLEAKASFRPYVGLGLTYAYFQKETGSGALTALTNTGSTTPTTFKVDSAWGLSPQIGLLYAINEKWFADFNITKTYLKTTAHYSTGQTIDIQLNPLSTSMALGYHF